MSLYLRVKHIHSLAPDLATVAHSVPPTLSRVQSVALESLVGLHAQSPFGCSANHLSCDDECFNFYFGKRRVAIQHLRIERKLSVPNRFIRFGLGF